MSLLGLPGSAELCLSRSSSVELSSVEVKSGLPFRLEEGNVIAHQYEIESILGHGGFGVVLGCHDILSGKKVAIKINYEESGTFRRTGKEISILKKLSSLDPETSNIVQWNGYFYCERTMCLLFELLDMNLAQYICERENQGVPVAEVRSVIHQLTTALSHLKDRGIVHGDLKPSNVMVVDRHSSPLRVKLIDFGLARHVSKCRAGDRIQTMCYKAPEILLGAPYNEAADVWTLGLMAAEMITCCYMYPGYNEYEVLSCIVATQGQPPDSVLNRGHFSRRYFQYRDGMRKPWKFMTPIKYSEKPLDSRDLRKYGFIREQPQDMREIWLRSLDDLVEILEENFGDSRENDELVDLIKRMLHLNQNQRITLQEIMDHPFMAPCRGMRDMEKEDCFNAAPSKIQENVVDVQSKNSKEDKGLLNPHIFEFEDDKKTAAFEAPESVVDLQSQNSKENTGRQNLQVAEFEDSTA